MNSEVLKTLLKLEENKTILYPTDTVWGIGCDATKFNAVAKVYKIKNRAEAKSLIVLVSSLHMLKKYVRVSKREQDIIRKSMKPTTIIYQNPVGLAKNVYARDNTIAIRIVQDDFCRKLIKKLGKPIVSTSANSSGDATPKSFSEIQQTILDSVDYVVNLWQNEQNNTSSTILKIVGNEIEVLRA